MKIGFLGAGAMGGAILTGAMPAGVLARHLCARVLPPARLGGRAGSKLCGDPGVHHLW